MFRDFSSGSGVNAQTTHIAVDDAPGRVVVADAELLLGGDFRRSGSDLVITGKDGHKVVVSGYFGLDKAPDLVTAQGAGLSGHVVEKLAASSTAGQYAQAGAPAAGGIVIGKVERLGGSATVQHANGVREELKVGDAVRQGDVVETAGGSLLAISFVDGTAFNMGANARMVLDELVYEAGGSSNTATFSLIKGTITFVAGQVAKTGNMKVDTPIATMGIRGTTVNWNGTVDVNNNMISSTISLMTDPNGGSGGLNVYDKTTGLIIATISVTNSIFTLTPTATLGVLAQQTNKTPEQIAQELQIAQILFPIFLANPANFANQFLQDQGTKSGGIHGSGTPFDQLFVTKLADGSFQIDGTLAGGNNVNQSNQGNVGGPGQDNSTPGDGPNPPPNPPPFILGSSHVRIADPNGFDAFAPNMSVDGRWIVFDPGEPHKVFLFDRLNPDAGPVDLTTGLDPDTSFVGAQVSLNGFWIVFQGEHDGGSDVYIYDNRPDELRGLDAGPRGRLLIEGSGNPHIDGGGNTIAVEQGGDLVVINRAGDVLDTIERGETDAGAWQPDLNASGRFMTFWTAAEDVVIDGHEIYLIGGGGLIAQVYLFDRLTGKVEIVSSTVHQFDPFSGVDPEFAGYHNSGGLIIDSSGNPIDLDQHDSMFFSNDAASPMSADGRFVVFQSYASNLVCGDNSDFSDIYLYDRQAGDGHLVWISKAADGGSNEGDSYRPIISPDGKFVIFTSNAGLVASDTNDLPDTYVWEQGVGLTLVSGGLFGASGDGPSSLGSAISGGGVFVAFGSTASNLTGDDANGSTSDVFLTDQYNGQQGILLQDPTGGDVLFTGGRIYFTDTDGGQSVSIVPSAGLLGHFDAPTVSGIVGTLGSIAWSYHVDADAVRALQYGDILQETATIHLTDGPNALDIPISVNIVGVNDDPTMDMSSVVATSYESDFGSFTDLMGISVHDPDHNGAGTFKLTAVSQEGADIGLSDNYCSPLDDLEDGNGLELQGTLADLNDTLANGIRYHDQEDGPATDTVTITVEDQQGGFDQWHVMFAVADAPSGITLNGTAGKDIIFGTDNCDTLNGNNGNDILIGGAGNDHLTGGNGNDIFVFDGNAFGHDKVTDFVQGQDKIVLDNVFADQADFEAFVAALPDGSHDITVNTGSVITLCGVDVGHLTTDDFIVRSFTGVGN